MAVVNCVGPGHTDRHLVGRFSESFFHFLESGFDIDAVAMARPRTENGKLRVAVVGECYFMRFQIHPLGRELIGIAAKARLRQILFQATRVAHIAKV